MTKDGSFKKVVRRHAQETGQRYTEALTDLEGLEARLFHQPVAERLLAHLRDHYGIDAVAATKISQHNDHVFRVDRRDGDPWIARVFPPARPRAGVEGDAAILRFLERQDYPAERLAVDDAVSDVRRHVGPRHPVRRRSAAPAPAVGPRAVEKFAIMGDLLGRLHALAARRVRQPPRRGERRGPQPRGQPASGPAGGAGVPRCGRHEGRPGRPRAIRAAPRAGALGRRRRRPARGVGPRQPPPRPRSRGRDRAGAGGDQLEGGRARPAPRRLRLSDVGHLARRGLDRRGRGRVPPTRRVDRRRARPARGGDVPCGRCTWSCFD